MNMASVRGATVLITGAASGMGLLYAERAAREGAEAIVLWDRDADGLKRAVQHLEQRGSAQLHPVKVDLAKPRSIERGYTQTKRRVGGIDVLINNAGIVTGNDFFWQTDMATQNEPTMRVNAVAQMHVTRLFLPDMIADVNHPKRVLNIASAAGTLANPRMAVYAASKWAMIGWSDSLRLELQQAGHGHVGVTTYAPSYVSTGMFEGARGMFLTPVMTPDQAVDHAWNAMLRAKPLQLSPWAVNIAKVLRGVLPVRAWDRAAKWMRVYSSMDEFTGRADAGKAD